MITRLALADRAGRRTRVELDGEPWAEVLTEAAVVLHLRAGLTLDAAGQSALLAEEAYLLARRAAAILLHHRLHAVEELRRKLAQRRLDPAAIDRAVAHFLQKGELDDRRFAGQFARQQARTGRAGPRKIRNLLRQKGVGEGLIDEALEACARDRAAAGDAAGDSDGGDAREREVRTFLEKRAARLREADPRRRLLKLRAALYRAGFDPEVCSTVLAAWHPGAEAADGEEPADETE